MEGERDWVLLCECHNTAELQVLRATLEAHGVPCQVQGEHTHSVLGPIHGAVARPRILVPRGGMALARELAEDIVGPFESSGEADDDGAPVSPYRTEPAAQAERAAALPANRVKSYGVLVLALFLLIPPFLGVCHLYAGRRAMAVLLAIGTVVALLTASGPALAIVWVVDVVGGGFAIAAHNRVARAELQAQADADDEDDLADAADPPAAQGDVDEPVDEGWLWATLRRLRS